MNKIALFTLLLLVLNISNAQDLNESNNGFFKVVQTEKSNPTHVQIFYISPMQTKTYTVLLTLT